MVKADYVPLLQSLAPYGWRLMCVLPTPIVKTNRYTRQIKKKMKMCCCYGSGGSSGNSV